MTAPPRKGNTFVKILAPAIETSKFNSSVLCKNPFISIRLCGKSSTGFYSLSEADFEPLRSQIFLQAVAHQYQLCISNEILDRHIEEVIRETNKLI